jgi:ABC-type multidrug transport system permease subunit
MTVFLTTHYMDEAQYLADRVAVMAAGEIVASGPPEALGGRDELPTEIRFGLPDGVELGDLPELPGAAVSAEGGGRVLVTTADGVPAAHALTGWALERGHELRRFTVAQPTLEDVYLALAGWQLRYSQRTFWRNRRASFFSLAFPLMYIVVFGLLTHGAHLDTRGGLAMIDFYVPGIVAYAIVLIGFNTTAMNFAALRSKGILKRIRLTPLPMWAYFGGMIASTVLVMALSIAIMLVVGTTVFGAHLSMATLPALLVMLALGGACFTSLGVAASAIVSKPENGMGILMIITLPLTFVSNVWFPLDGAPAWLNDLAGAFPLKPLADGIAHAFDPATAGPGFAGHDLIVLGLWTIAGCAMMARTMRGLSRRA